MSDECEAGEAEVAIDNLLDQIEETISVAKGKGSLTEDKHDEISGHVREIRDINSKLKCLLSSIPSSSPEPESIVRELDEKIGETVVG